MGTAPSVQRSDTETSAPSKKTATVKHALGNQSSIIDGRKFSLLEIGETAAATFTEMFSTLSTNGAHSYDQRKQFWGDDNMPYSRQVQFAWQCPKGHPLVPTNISPSVEVAPLECASRPSSLSGHVQKKAMKNSNQPTKIDMDPLQLQMSKSDAMQEPGIQSDMLRMACADGNVDLVAKLLDQGADVNDQNVKGVTPLHSCVFALNVELAQLLIQHGADHMQSDENEMAAIHYAAAEGALELVRLFVQCAGSSIAGLVGVEGITPAHMAANMGHNDVLLYISEVCGPEYCDQLDRRGNSPMHLASSWGHTECVNALLRMGCSANVRNANCMTPLMIAINTIDVHKTIDVVRLLLPFTEVLESDGIAIPVELIGDDKFVSSLSSVIYEEDVAIENASKLHAAIFCGSDSDLRVLLFAGAKVDVYDASGFTPVHYACCKSRLDMVALMLNFGDTVKLATSLLKLGTDSPLICAISANSCPLVQYLVRKFPSWLEVRDSEGTLPIVVALDNDCGLDLVRALVVGGADLKASAKTLESAVETNVHVVSKSKTVSVHQYARKFHNEAAQFIRVVGIDPIPMQLCWCDEIAKYVDIWNRGECTLIHQAAFLGRTSEVHHLLKSSGPLAVGKDAAGFTALHAACAGGFLQIVNLLLEASCLVDSSDNEAAISPLFFAVNGGFPVIVERLLPLILDASSLYDAQERSLLFFLPHDEGTAIAISSALLSIFPFLDETVENPVVNANIQCMRERVQSAASCIVNADPTALSVLLARLPLLIHCRMNFEGHTLLHMACERLDAATCVEVLCKFGAPVESILSNGLSPLHVAALYKNLPAMNILLSYGASPDLPDQNGFTPLHIVAMESFAGGIELLQKQWHAESMNADFLVKKCNPFTPVRNKADLSTRNTACLEVGYAVCDAEKVNMRITTTSSENMKMKCHVCLVSTWQSDSFGWFACSVEKCCESYAVCDVCIDILQAKERSASPVFSNFLENSQNGRVSPNVMMPIAALSKFGLSFDKKGVRLAFLREFKALHSATCGHMTTEQICHILIKPQTSLQRCSVVVQLSQANALQNWGECSNWFVSHAWSNLFFPMIDAILSFFKHRSDGETAVIWMDLFSISQHANPESEISPLWWRAFSKCIEDSRKVLLVIESWRDPIPLKRSWCLLEILTILREVAKHKGAFFRILIYEEAYNDMMSVVRDNPEEFCSKLSESIRGIHVESSKSTFEEERTHILKLIENFGTFDMLDCNISGIVENWMFDMLRQMTLDSIKTGDEDALFRFRLSLAKVFTDRGRLNEALQQRELRMEWLYKLFDSHLTDNSDEIVTITVALADALADVANAYARLRRFKDALKFQLEAQKYYQRVLNEDDLQHAKIMASIAQTHFNLEEGKQALRLIESTLEFYLKVLPTNDPRIFSAEAAVAAMHRGMQDFETAFDLEMQVLEKRLKNLPYDHIDIGSSHFSIALTLPFVESLSKLERNARIMENLQMAVKVWRYTLHASDPKVLLAKQKIEVFEESLKHDA